MIHVFDGKNMRNFPLFLPKKQQNLGRIWLKKVFIMLMLSPFMAIYLNEKCRCPYFAFFLQAIARNNTELLAKILFRMIRDICKHKICYIHRNQFIVNNKNMNLT